MLWLSVVVAITRLPRLFQSLAMTMCLWLPQYPIPRLPRLFQSLAMTVCGYCHCEEWNDEAIHKPLIVNTKIEKKKKSLFLSPFVIAKAKGLWQSINHHYFIHSQKRKRNHYYLINQRTNFQFSISLSTPLLLRNFPPYKGRQAPISHQ